MTLFLDTSASLALLNREDPHHARAGTEFERARGANEELITTNYVLMETIALIQRTLGLDAVRAFLQGILPLVSIAWVTEEEHRQALAALLAANRRDLSFVDCVSFEVMRARGIARAFAFDADFERQGFDRVP